ncbi:MAG: hypothetical protein K2X66_08750, partial [Cyanobacteria bacterium]|nr:hypothetical protein [Cyanobacteriota bacterium]
MAWNDFLNNFGKNKEKPKSNGSALSSPPKADGPNSLNIFGSQLAQPSKNLSSGESSPKLPTEFLSQKPGPKPQLEQRKLNGLTQDDVIDPEQAFETARLENPSHPPSSEALSHEHLTSESNLNLNRDPSADAKGMNGSSEMFAGITNPPDPMAQFQSNENLTASPLSAELANGFLSTPHNNLESTFDSPSQNLTAALGSTDLFASLSPSTPSLTPDPFSQLSGSSGSSETSDPFASLSQGGESVDLFASLNTNHSSQLEAPITEAPSTESQDLFQYPMGNEDLLNFTSSNQEMDPLNAQTLPDEAPEILDSANDLLAFLNTNGSISQNISPPLTSSEAATTETESNLPEMVDDAFLMDQANDLLSSFTSGNNHFGGSSSFTSDEQVQTTDNENDSLSFMNTNDALSSQNTLSASPSPNPLEDLLAQFSNKPGGLENAFLDSPQSIAQDNPETVPEAMQDLMLTSEPTKLSSNNGLEDLLAQFSSTQTSPGEAADSTNMLQAPFDQELSMQNLEAQKPINPLEDLLAQFKPSESKEDASAQLQTSPSQKNAEIEAIKESLNLNPLAQNLEMSIMPSGKDPVQNGATPLKSTEATKAHNPMEDLLSKLSQSNATADPFLSNSGESQDLLKDESEDLTLQGAFQADSM